MSFARSAMRVAARAAAPRVATRVAHRIACRSWARTAASSSAARGAGTGAGAMRRLHVSSPAASGLRIGDQAPDFTQASTAGTINFHEWIGDSWAILFSHPADYTPVCTTELGYMQKILPEFEKRNVKVLALSVDSLDDHAGWVEDIKSTQGVPEVSYPILADEDRSVAKLYGMLDDSNIMADGLPATVRSVFVIGPDKNVKLIITYPASTGRNFDEVLRVVDSLQLTAYKQVATPVNWQDGQECVIVPSVSDEQAKELFPQGWNTVRPYLRLVNQPKDE